jgi:hypothetical protein
MDTFELYKELYHKENDRRNEVQNALNIPIAIISALSTGIYFFVTTFDYKVSLILNYIFCVLCIITTLTLIMSIFYLVRAFSNFTKGYEYTGLAYPQELYNWNLELESYYHKYGVDIIEAEKQFKKHIIEKLVKHTDHNMYVNDKKYGYIYNSKKYLILGLTTLLLTTIPFGYNYFHKKESVQQIKVVDSDSTLNNKVEQLKK